MQRLQAPAGALLGSATCPATRPSTRIRHSIEEIIMDINWTHVAFKTCAYTYICFLAWIAWHILPFAGHWSVGHQELNFNTDLTVYFQGFHGGQDCRIDASHLYSDSSRDGPGMLTPNAFCATRQELLTSMSGGGRVGFDAPYIARGCTYAWFDIPSICMIIERFERVVFIGDHSLQPLYSGLNILLRQDLAHGTLQTWHLNADTLEECRCGNQFIKESCRKQSITSSEQVLSNIPHDLESSEQTGRRHQQELTKGSSYVCSHMIPHTFFEIDSGIDLDKDTKLNPKTIQKLQKLFPKHSSPTYKHTAVILSLSPQQTQTTITARQTLLSILDFLFSNHEEEKQVIPKPNILYLGPPSPTHLTTRSSKNDRIKTNQEIWDFHHTLAQTAIENKADVLGLWNMTAQVGSWDGEHFGPGVALTQAMMVINWLARLESS